MRTVIEIAIYRHQMDRKLRLSEERYRSLFEDAPSANFTATMDGLVCDCNTAFVKLLGYKDKASVLGTNLHERFFDRKEGALVFERIAASDSSSAEYWDLVSLDGTKKTAFATVADFLEEGRFSDAFARLFLLPMTAAIWSSGTES